MRRGWRGVEHFGIAFGLSFNFASLFWPSPALEPTSRFNTGADLSKVLKKSKDICFQRLGGYMLERA